MGDFVSFYNQYQVPLIAVAAGLSFFAFLSGVIEMILGARKSLKSLGVLNLKRFNLWGRKNF